MEASGKNPECGWMCVCERRGALTLTCSLEVEPDLPETPHHVFELQQEGKQAVVLVHAAVGDDDVQRPVHLGDHTEERRPSPRENTGVSASECEGKWNRMGEVGDKRRRGGRGEGEKSFQRAASV